MHFSLFSRPGVQQVIVVTMLGVLFIGTGIGLRDPWPSDEPRFAMIAKDMVETGQWLFPTRAGELYADKPPVFMWAAALVYQVTGSLRVATLLPSLLAGLMVLFLIQDMGRRLFNRRTGTVAALALLAMPQFVLEARSGQIDAMVMAWIALGMYSFLRYLLVDGQRRWLIVGFAACGLGIITKGVGFLPLLLFPLAWLSRNSSQPMNRVGARNVIIGVTVLIATVSLWLAPMLVAVSLSGDPALEAYRDNILWEQTAERYAAPSHHFKPAWYFVAEVIPSLWLPLFVLLPWVVPAWWRRIRRGDVRYRLLLGWVVLVVLFFTLSPAKRGVYILPALPWATLALAPLLTGLLKRRSIVRLAAIGCGVFAVLGLAGAGYLQFVEPETSTEVLERFGMALPVPLLMAGLGAVIGAGLAMFRRPGRALLAMMLSWWLVLGLWIYPRLDPVKSGAELMEKVENELGADQPLALVEWREQTRLQARRPVATFGFLVPAEEQWDAAVDWLADHPQGAVLAQSVDARCDDDAQVTPLGIAHRREWFLIEPIGNTIACQ